MADRTGDIYREHHAKGERYGFTISGDERGAWFAARIQEASAALAKPKLDLLDIGCRDGTLTRMYAGGHALRGLDVDGEAVRRAVEAGLDVKKHDLNLEALPFPRESFDLVVAGEVLEHLQWPKVVVADIHAALRPGGYFIGSVPNAFRLRNRLQFLLGREFEVDPTHLHSFSPSAVRELLAPFRSVRLEFHGGRRRNLHPELMATQLHWIAIK